MRGEDFERMFAEHANSLFAMFVYRTGDRALAEDLVADTFERVMRSGRRFDPRRGSEKNWLYTIGLNLLRDHVRRQGIEHQSLQKVGAVGDGEGGWSHEGVIEQREELQRALRGLSDDEREAIALRFGADLTVREIARIVGQGQPAVEKRLSRALAKLRASLE